MTPAPLSPRSEPLLWVQPLGLAALPLEALLLLLLLAGTDPGPLAPLERILGWGIGSLAPALLLWRRPADVWSLLLVRTPPQGRRDLQRRLSALQSRPLLQAFVLGVGSLLSLVLLWWADGHGAVATALSPIRESPRLVALLLASALLALIQWQWQQGIQALWLLGRDSLLVQQAEPLSPAALEAGRLSPGLSLLLPAPLSWAGAPQPPATPPSGSVAPSAPGGVAPTASGDAAGPPEPAGPGAEPAEATPGPPSAESAGQPSAGRDVATSDAGAEPSAAGLPVAVEPEQPAADEHSDELDQEIG